MAVEAGVSTVEREFLADLVLPGHRATVYEQIGDALGSGAGQLPLLLAAGDR